MKTWSIQSPFLWNQFLKDDRIFPNSEIIREYWGKEFFEMVKYCYPFLLSKLSQKINKPFDYIEFPFWHWIRWGGIDRPRPDLRFFRWAGDPGDKMVRIEFDIPDSLILILNYDEWQFLMNRYYDHFFEEKRLASIKRTLAFKNLTYRDYPFSEPEFRSLNKEYEKNFNKIFHYDDSTIQVAGITWELRKEWVRKVDFFTIDKRAFYYSKLREKTSTK